MNEVVADVFRDATVSSAAMIQPLDLISLAIEDVTANDQERATLRQIYTSGGFGGHELEVQNENEARALVEQKLAKMRDQ